MSSCTAGSHKPADTQLPIDNHTPPHLTHITTTPPTNHPLNQGASTSEVSQKLYSSASHTAIKDDPLGYGTLYPSVNNRHLPDLSATPNRLLQSRLAEQLLLSPGTLQVGADDTGPQQVEVKLVAQPAAPVIITAEATAAWDGAPLADVSPAQVTVAPGDWNASGAAVFTVRPREVSEGTYFVQFDLT